MNQRSLGSEYEPTAPPSSSPTGAAAAAAYGKEKAKTVGERVLVTIWEAGPVKDEFDGGMIAEQVQERLDRGPQSITPRITDLKRQGFIQTSGKKRLTRSGNEAEVYELTAQGIRAVQRIFARGAS